jgi:hypothetical protein
MERREDDDPASSGFLRHSRAKRARTIAPQPAQQQQPHQPQQKQGW